MIDQKAIDLLTLLQPEIREAMGEWKIGDRGWDTVQSEDVIYIGKVYQRDVPLFCIMDMDGRRTELTVMDLILRIPLALPLPGREVGRTLWGMVEGTDRKVKLTHITDGSYVISILVSAQGITNYEADTPYLALLKRLAKQHGKEV